MKTVCMWGSVWVCICVVSLFYMLLLWCGWMIYTHWTPPWNRNESKRIPNRIFIFSLVSVIRNLCFVAVLFSKPKSKWKNWTNRKRKWWENMIKRKLKIWNQHKIDYRLVFEKKNKLNVLLVKEHTQNASYASVSL